MTIQQKGSQVNSCRNELLSILQNAVDRLQQGVPAWPQEQAELRRFLNTQLLGKRGAVWKAVPDACRGSWANQCRETLTELLAEQCSGTVGQLYSSQNFPWTALFAQAMFRGDLCSALAALAHCQHSSAKEQYLEQAIQAYAQAFIDVQMFGRPACWEIGKRMAEDVYHRLIDSGLLEPPGAMASSVVLLAGPALQTGAIYFVVQVVPGDAQLLPDPIRLGLIPIGSEMLRSLWEVWELVRDQASTGLRWWFEGPGLATSYLLTGRSGEAAFLAAMQGVIVSQRLDSFTAISATFLRDDDGRFRRDEAGRLLLGPVEYAAEKLQAATATLCRRRVIFCPKTFQQLQEQLPAWNGPPAICGCQTFTEAWNYLSRPSVGSASTLPMLQVGQLELGLAVLHGGDGSLRYRPGEIFGHIAPEPFQLPEPLQKEYPRLLEKRKNQVQSSAAFVDKEQLRLVHFQLQSLDPPKPMSLVLQRTRYYYTCITNIMCHEVLQDGRRVADFGNLDHPDDLRNSQFSNPLAVNLSIVTEDGYVLFARRSQMVAYNRGGWAPAVSGTAVPDWDIHPDPTSGQLRYDPWRTAIREARGEVLGQYYRSVFHPEHGWNEEEFQTKAEEITFFGLARVSRNGFPFLFGEARPKLEFSNMLRLGEECFETARICAVPLGDLEQVADTLKTIYATFDSAGMPNQATHTTIFSILQSFLYTYPDRWDELLEALQI
ncbi:MAG: hypothetical protein NZ602_14710 [Thermoguttaceae bacterium]|nr:hypothetical protein [Thermoguttaceae bacterium]MDW8038395.1 hypothetical protein [Thermoguttaceae bacterium]